MTMTAEQFDVILDNRLEATRATLGTKAVEYASAKDRLHNFKRAAGLTGESPAQVCVGFLVKHLVSVLDIVDDHAKGDKRRIGLVDEKLGDAVNYLVLLEALLKE